MEFITLILIPTIISAHSWAACTKYNTQDTNYLTFGKFDHSKCLGYPRAYQAQLGAELSQTWGTDTGYDWEHEQCRLAFDNSEYSDATPMAIYYSGETIHISHPAKNHVADVCTNEFIPSASMKLLMSSIPMSDTFDISVPMIGKDHQFQQIDHLGYQNCFEFCSNPDKAHCITSWTIPTIINTGRYSFKWLWEFNSGQFYSTCFDAIILLQPNQSVPNNVTTPIPTPASSVPVYPIPTPASSVPVTITTSEPTTSTTVSPTTNEPSTTVSPTTNDPSTRLPITSDASQLKSIFNDIFKSIRITFNGTLNFTMFATP
jgi:hypothetical protein